MISTAIKLDGEAEFKKQLGDVNSNLKTLKSEMQLTTEQFKGQANSMEALTAKDQILRREIEQQEEKVRALTQALEDASEVYADSPGKIDKYQQSLNRAKADLINMQRELADTDRYLDEAKTSADKTAKSIDGFGKEAKDAGKDLDGIGGGIGSFIGKLGDLKNIVAGGAVVGGVVALKDAILGVVEETEEYRKIMGTLETSSQAAGYSAEQTTEAYNRLYGVLGDTQTTATTIANLQAIGLSQEDLMGLIDATTGAWATYGDSIPIDGLAESINETIKAGQVTGTFADVLNWAGESEDAFNEKLANAKTQSERANIVLQALAEQGLAETGQAWRDNNEDIVEMNESQAKLEAAMGRMGELLAPLAANLVSFGADALGFVIDKVKAAVDWFDRMIDKISNFKWEGGANFVQKVNSWFDGGSTSAGVSAATTGMATSNVNERPAASAADVYSAAAAAGAKAGAQGGSSGDINIVIHEEIGGAEVARKQFSYNQAEAQRRGTSLVNK